ncbi:MAG: MATE family efflux transporter [Alphaproteobacteria bacterium]
MRPRRDLVNGPVAPLVRALAVPAATGYLFNTLYNVVDSVYAGLWSTAALAALGASFPVFFVVVATMAGLGQGATGLIARALGADDRDRARALAGQARLVAVAGGVAAAVLGLALAGPVLDLLSIRGEARAYALDYLVPILLAAPLFLLNAVVNARLAAQGDTKSYRNALVAGALVNIALDPLLMFTFGLGVAGIAWATVLVQAATLAYLHARTRRDGLAAGELPLRPRPDLLAALVRQALPATGNMTLIGVALFTVTAFVGRHGEAALAAYSVGLRLEQLFLLPTVGLNAATLTLVGNAFGAARFERITHVLRVSTGWGLVVMGTGTVLLFTFREPLIALFSRDPAVIDAGARYLAVAALIQCASVFNMMGGATLQGIGQPIWSFVVTVGRSLIAPAALLALGQLVFGWGLDAIFWTLFAINWTAALVLVLVVRWRLRTTCGLELARALAA